MSRGDVPLRERVYSAEDVGRIIAWFGGSESRWWDHVRADASDVVNVGRAERTSFIPGQGSRDDWELWYERARRLCEQALEEDWETEDPSASISAANECFEIAHGNVDPAEMDGYPFPGEEPQEPICTCPPELLERGGYKGGCPRHSLVPRTRTPSTSRR